MREFLSAQQQRLHSAETELSQQLQRIAAELADDRRQTRTAQEEITQRSGQLQHQAELLEQMKAEQAQRQAEWEKLYRNVVEQQQSLADQLKLQQDEFARRQQDLLQQQSAAAAAQAQLLQDKTAAEAQFIRDKQETEAARAELENQRTQLQAIRDSLETQQAELENNRQELAARNAETESRRRSIARELKTRHSAHQKELECERIELERTINDDRCRLQRQLEALQEECRTLRNNPPAADKAVDPLEAAKNEAEKKELAARLAGAEAELAETRRLLALAQSDQGEGDEDEDSFRRRYEMAVDDLHKLKALNDNLQQQLAQSHQAGAVRPAQIAPGALDWEAEKKRILAALEADFEEDNEEDNEEKLKIEGVIRKTNKIVAEREREIGELRGLLESQTHNIGTMAVGAAALGQILDSDAVILEERKNLVHLQEQCRDKLRQAEVEISLERAKVARERSQLEEKLRVLEQQGIDLKSVSTEKDPPKPTRGRWLARLGLTENENEQKQKTRGSAGKGDSKQ